MVMPFSRSRSIESITRSATSAPSRKAPDCQSIASTSVVLPWSTCATIATLRRSLRGWRGTAPSLGGVEADAELGQAAQHRGLAMAGRRAVGDAQAGEPDERVDGDLALEARERVAEAEVRAHPEREVAAVGARHVELVGALEARRVAVGRPEQDHDPRAGGNRLAAELDVIERDARGELHRRVVAQQL